MLGRILTHGCLGIGSGTEILSETSTAAISTYPLPNSACFTGVYQAPPPSFEKARPKT